LSQVCADIEAKIRADKLEDAEARVDEMCAEIEIVLQALKRLLDAST
jgi:HPt (histidine-containing phosphotransfer) domain-containing protein